MNIRFAATEASLRDDVRQLGSLLGEVLKTEGEEDLFQRVEAARVFAEPIHVRRVVRLQRTRVTSYRVRPVVGVL